MAKKQEFTKGQESYIRRYVKKFQEETQKALNNFESKTKEKIEELDTVVSNETNEITNLEEKEKNLDIKLKEVSDFHSTIFKGDENGDIISKEIEGFVEEFKSYKNQIDTLKTDIEKYGKELFGYEDDKGDRINGLRYKIETLTNESQKLIKDSRDKYKNLFDEIEGLLKGASTVALAEAFHEHKKSFDSSNHVWGVVFVVSIISMMSLSIWGFVEANYEFKDMWKYTLGNLPFMGGAVWLAIYSSKQKSQNKRLQQEYAYKEDVAKIYYGLKKEVEKLEDSSISSTLNDEIIRIIMSVVAYNPSKTLDNNSHNDKGPILGAFDKITKSK